MKEEDDDNEDEEQDGDEDIFREWEKSGDRSVHNVYGTSGPKEEDRGRKEKEIKTRGVMFGMSAFLACVCHQCFSASSSLGWGLKFRTRV